MRNGQFRGYFSELANSVLQGVKQRWWSRLHEPLFGSALTECYSRTWILFMFNTHLPNDTVHENARSARVATSERSTTLRYYLNRASGSSTTFRRFWGTANPIAIQRLVHHVACAGFPIFQHLQVLLRPLSNLVRSSIWWPHK